MRRGCNRGVVAPAFANGVWGNPPRVRISKRFLDSYTERSHSGLVRTLGKGVWGNPPGVRISLSPPFENQKTPGNGRFCFFARRSGSGDYETAVMPTNEISGAEMFKSPCYSL